ncbi:hypothetical protein SCP_1602030 [Sparassis crispa]|uniref:BTB domain-containing protein n=1 Tax=Sparassis crispa TaxID=139825 RepID=A0A401H569_9APHY|nr:hypothetical protein SCP_1602030 [Sparassis crispa]GBE89541.1 hypothetical protein SCP_1602030 [Sparassis crispa]
MASPVLHALITSLHLEFQEGGRESDATSAEDLLTLHLDEDSRTLAALLGMCYPAERFTFHDFGVVKVVLDAAQKYEIEMAISSIKKQWTSLAEAEPLREYFAAWHHKLDECARDAAYSALKYPIDVPTFRRWRAHPRRCIVGYCSTIGLARAVYHLF